MKYYLCLIILLGFASACDAQFLDQYLWEHRLIIIYESTDHFSEKANLQERSLLFHENELIERKLKVIRYNGTTLRNVFPMENKELKRDLHLRFDGDYETLLIGLDGSIKARYSDVKSPDLIFDFIDSMPMRRSEIRKAGNE